MKWNDIYWIFQTFLTNQKLKDCACKSFPVPWARSTSIFLWSVSEIISLTLFSDSIQVSCGDSFIPSTMLFCLDCPSRFIWHCYHGFTHRTDFLSQWLTDCFNLVALLFQLIKLTLGELQTVLHVLDLSGQVIHYFISRIHKYLEKNNWSYFLVTTLFVCLKDPSPVIERHHCPQRYSRWLWSLS